MEAAPPTYEAATLRNHWTLLANYLPFHDLCSCALVCSRWHTTFSPHIWGNPASNFRGDNDAVHAALIRFQHALRTARLSVRNLAHTLHVPAVDVELYDSPNEDWLGNVLERLPNLQALIVRGVSSFDHGALQALIPDRNTAKENRRPGTEPPPSIASAPAISPFGLRLLDASRCDNATPSGLGAALRRFEDLVYLDLSSTSATRSSEVLDAVGKCTGLQVLKLRGIGLRDAGLDLLCRLIGLRIRSLDIRDNEVTDRGIEALLHHSFIDDATFARQRQRPLGSGTLSIYQSEKFEAYLRKTFTKDFVSRLAIEDAPAAGLTHLYISGNRTTEEGIFALLQTGRLHVLDVGLIKSATERSSSSSSRGAPSRTYMGDIVKLVPELAKPASRSLTYLRVDSRLITDQTGGSSEETESERVGLSAESPPWMLHDPSHLDTTSAGRQANRMPTDEQTPPPYEVDYQPTEARLSAPQYDTVNPAITTDLMANGRGQDELESGHVDQRTKRIQHSTLPTRSTSAHLDSSMLPRLETLVLTDFPPLFPDRTLADRIIAFIQSCAREATFARQQAAHDYDVAPGRRGKTSKLQASTSKYFALRRIVLELAPQSVHHARTGVAGSSARQTQEKQYKSMTEDHDSEAFWLASERDFSFFSGEENPVDSSSNPDGDTRSSHPAPDRLLEKKRKSFVDNIAVISAFRKERKLAHQRMVAAGEINAEIEGLWNGIISVVRDSGRPSEDDETNYHGT